jgi:hypothetical protein
MKFPLELNNGQHVEMFQCAGDMVRGLAQLVAIRNPVALDELDIRMAAGTVVRLTLSVGSAGPLGLLFQGVRPDGTTFDLVTIDAPPSTAPFRFGR